MPIIPEKWFNLKSYDCVTIYGENYTKRFSTIMLHYDYQYDIAIDFRNLVRRYKGLDKINQPIYIVNDDNKFEIFETFYKCDDDVEDISGNTLDI